MRTKFQGLKYLCDCEYRKAMGTNNYINIPEDKRPTHCEMMSDIVGTEVMTNPLLCAQCTSEGKTNSQTMKAYVNGVLRQHVNYALAGFYTDKQDIKHIITQLWKTRSTNDQNIDKFVAMVLEKIVAKGVLTYEEATELIKTEMPQLGA